MMSRRFPRQILVSLVLAMTACNTPTALRHELTLLEMYEVIKTKTFVDLTHSFAPGIPRWPGFPDEERTTLYWHEPGVGTMGQGFFAEQFTHVGQWGTHVDPPGAFVALRTDWSRRWPDMAAMQNKDADGISHYPGWSREVLRYLYERKKITASGHETTDTDPGIATSRGDYSLETYILSTDHYQVELLANLDRVPERGALVVVSFPKPRNGSGFPARVFAILP